MEEHLGIKKLHLNKKGNSLLANNFLKYLRSTFWDDIDSNCFEVNVHECESKLDIPDRLSDVVSERSLKVIRTKNPNRIVLSHLNINSLRNKFDILTDQISGNVDVMVISETKLDDSFPESQFKIPGYSSSFRLDRDQNSGGIMVFVREDITVKFLSFEDKPFETLFIELNFRKKKKLFSCSYNPSKNHISNDLQRLRNSLDLYSAKYENIILIWDFNLSPEDPHMERFCE